MTYSGYEQDRALRGPAAANALLEFEEAQLAQYIALVEAEPDIDCDLHVTRACDVFFDAKEAESARRSFLLRKEDHPRAVEAGDVREITDRAELERVSGMKGGYWGATYPAGHLWPYKLTCGRKLAPDRLDEQEPPLTSSFCLSRSRRPEMRAQPPDQHTSPLRYQELILSPPLDSHDRARDGLCVDSRHRHQRLHCRHPSRLQGQDCPRSRNSLQYYSFSVTSAGRVAREVDILIWAAIRRWAVRFFLHHQIPTNCF